MEKHSVIHVLLSKYHSPSDIGFLPQMRGRARLCHDEKTDGKIHQILLDLCLCPGEGEFKVIILVLLNLNEDGKVA